MMPHSIKKDVPENNDNHKKPISDWREDERPRERLVKNGASSLSDSELLAILIASGTKGFSALDIGRELLEKFQDLNTISSRDYSDLISIKGLGRVKSIKLAAAFELSKRIKAEPFDSKKVINSPEDISRYYIPFFQNITKERFLVLLLNSANQIFREVKVSDGLLDRSMVHPREVFKTAISENAASIIIVHNHPSGSSQPSNEDIAVTKILKDAGEIIGIKVLDHLIIAGNDFYSFKKSGLI